MRKSLKTLSSFARAIGRLVLAVVALLSIAALVLWFARVGVVVAALRAALPHGDGCENTFTIKRLGLDGVEVADARLGGFPCAPSFRTLRVRCSLSGLKAKRIDAIEIDGVGIDASHTVPGFRMPALGAAGEPPPRRDVLQGWRIGSVSARTELLDFAPLLGTNAPAWLSDSAKAKLSLTGGFKGDALVLRAAGALAGRPLSMDARYSPGGASGSASLAWRVPGVGGAEWQPLERVSASLDFSFAEARGMDFTGSGRLRAEPCEWGVPFHLRVTPDGAFSASASMTGVRMSESDPLAKAALTLAKVLCHGVAGAMPKDLEFSGEVNASVEFAAGGAAPAWSAKCSVGDLSLSLKAGAIPFAVSGGRLRVAADGCGALVRVSPCFIGFDEASIGLVPFGKGRATILPEDKSLVVSEASVGFCGGAVRIYALYLNLEKLATGFTLMLDNLLFADAITLFPKLAGSTATGRLYGRLPLRYADGQVRLGEGFVYTPPGETGNVNISNPEVVTGLLAQAGLPKPVCDNFSAALRDLDYEVFRVDMSNPRGDDGRIAIRLQGKSTSGKVVTPVNLNANVNGPIEKFLNLTIKTAKMGN